MKLKRITTLLLSTMIAASLFAGCGGVNKDKTVATLNGEPVKLGIANFTVRLQQANADDFYKQLFGDTVWTSDTYGTGMTTEDSFKEDAIASVQEMYTLQLHMEDYGVSLSDEEKDAIAKAAETFMSDNKKDAIEALGATTDIVEEYLTLTTIQNKMHDAIIADVDTNVTDEEAKTSSYSYVVISKTSEEEVQSTETAESTETADETSDSVKTQAGEFAKAAQTDGLETAAETYGYTVSSGTFTADDTGLDAEVLETLQKLKEGGVSGLIDTESSYYVVRLDAEVDEKATEENRKSIISERQENHYNEVLDGWEETDKWELDEKVWASVSFDNLFALIEESTESAVDTETATELQ